jgi:hypothetical protein
LTEKSDDELLAEMEAELDWLIRRDREALERLREKWIAGEFDA